MHDAIEKMLSKYHLVTATDYINAYKEIIQEIALVGLWRAKFYEIAAFYGGTALRIFYGLDRFSEDLDFTLLRPDTHVSLKPYLEAIKQELESYGFKINIQPKKKSKDSEVQSAFLKSDTIELLLKVGIKASNVKELKIKIELDTNPPPDFGTSIVNLFNPTTCSVKIVEKKDLFAGKMHALLYRKWQDRVKGRDWYDFIWYVKEKIPLNLKHLESRIRQSGEYEFSEPLNKDIFYQLLNKKIDSVNFERAKEDVFPFIKDKAVLNLWNRDFFKGLAQNIVFENSD